MSSCTVPSMDDWLREAKCQKSASKIGMYLIHNGVVRESAKAMVHNEDETAKPVVGMEFSYNREKLETIIADAYGLPGIYYIRVWLNHGVLQVGEELMYVLVGGDIRPHTVQALEYLVGRIKNECVKETELWE